MGTAEIQDQAENPFKQLDRNAILADFTLLFAPGLIACPQAFRSLKSALLLQATTAAALAALLFNGYGKCGNDFCPMKDVRRVIIGV